MLPADVSAEQEPRSTTLDRDLDRVMGGGVVPGSLTLIGGEPGIGKSTLLLQTVLHLTGRRVLYVSGEESERQIKLRADRIGQPQGEVLLLCETRLERVFDHIKAVQPDLVVVDSIHTVAVAGVSADTRLSLGRYVSGDLEACRSYICQDTGAGTVTFWATSVLAEFTVELVEVK